jgi:hypothetical protein
LVDFAAIQVTFSRLDRNLLEGSQFGRTICGVSSRLRAGVRSLSFIAAGGENRLRGHRPAQAAAFSRAGGAQEGVGGAFLGQVVAGARGVAAAAWRPAVRAGSARGLPGSTDSAKRTVAAQ